MVPSKLPSRFSGRMLLGYTSTSCRPLLTERFTTVCLLLKFMASLMFQTMPTDGRRRGFLAVVL